MTLTKTCNGSALTVRERWTQTTLTPSAKRYHVLTWTGVQKVAVMRSLYVKMLLSKSCCTMNRQLRWVVCGGATCSAHQAKQPAAESTPRLSCCFDRMGKCIGQRRKFATQV